MAEKVEIIVTAKDSASQILRGISGSFAGIGNAVQMLTSGGAIEALTSEIIKFGKESVDATVAYADEVRRLSQISGQSAEETSRLIQLADDYKISTGDLTVAMRKLTNEGLALNVQTLAKLSDEYLKLNPGQERAAFLMEKFGRQGVKFAEIMGKGGDEILRLNDSIDENLIITDKAVQQAREYEMAMDSWEEQTQKLQYALGVKLVPALTKVIDGMNTQIAMSGKSRAEIISYIKGMEDAAKEAESATQSYMAMAKAQETSKKAIDDGTGAIDEQAASLEELSKINLNTIQSIDDVAAVEKDYNQEMMDIAAERIEVEAARAEEMSKGWQTNKEKVGEYDQKLRELDAKTAETAAKHKEATDKLILNNTLAALSVGGLTKAEMDQYLAVEVAMGKITQKDKEMAQKQQELIDKFIAGKIKADELARAVELLPSGKSIDVILNMVTNIPNGITKLTSTGSPLQRPRASGGPVSAGDWFRVNETNQEYFRPSVGGSVMPIGPGGGGGSGVTVVIQADTIIGDRAHIENYLLPVIREGMRQVNAGR